jgi:hypothetical protein
MVDDFLRKAKDFIGGSKGEERERDFDEGESRGRRVRPASEDPYGDPADQEYYGDSRRSRRDRDDDDDEEYSDNVRRSRRDRDDDDDEEYSDNVRRSRRDRDDDDDDE